MKHLFFTIIFLTSILASSQDSPNKLIKKSGDTISFEHYSRIYYKNKFTYYTEPLPEKSATRALGTRSLGIRIEKKQKLKGEKQLPIEDIEKLILNTKFRYTRENDANFFLPYSKFIKIKNRYIKVEIITEGFCELYIDLNDPSTYKFYVKRKTEENPVEIQAQTGFGKRFKKVGPKYFEDCNIVLELISKSEYKTRLDFLINTLEEIVNSYNENCHKE